MRVETLCVENFRHLQSQEISFVQGVNEVIGDNAEGKTSVLEAVHLLILGSSFRTHQLKDLIQIGKPRFSIHTSCNLEGVNKTLSISYDGMKRAVSIDSQPQLSSSFLLGNLLGVTSTLEDQELIFGPPAIRRRFLDEQIAQIDPYYIDQYNRYMRALAHRNRLLKNHDFYTIKAWEEHLAKSSAYIVRQRRATVDLLEPLVKHAYQTLFPNEANIFSFRYVTQVPETDLENWCLTQYSIRREHEARYGSTLIGPHRDDIECALGGVPLKITASLGQARSVAFSLRYAEWELLAKRSQQKPLFLFDDIESTFDPVRKKIILKICNSLGQVFLTGHEYQSQTSHILTMKGGRCQKNNI